jgi:hypothetical protein
VKNSAEKLSRENAHLPYGHSMSASPSRKYMKTHIYKDFAQRLLKSLKIFSVKKLSTASPIRHALTR